MATYITIIGIVSSKYNLFREYGTQFSLILGVFPFINAQQERTVLLGSLGLTNPVSTSELLAIAPAAAVEYQAISAREYGQQFKQREIRYLQRKAARSGLTLAPSQKAVSWQARVSARSDTLACFLANIQQVI